MKTLIFFLSVFLSFVATASGLRSASQVVSFNCSISSAVGLTQLKFDSAKNKQEVSGTRNTIIPVSYSLASAGQYGTTQKSHISLSGGSLARNQYLSLIFSSQLPTGKVRASGVVMLATMGGSVFSPILQSSLPVGTVTCASIVIK